MSTPPKEPKPDDASAARRGAGPVLEHTFLGVAPAAPEPPATAGSGATGAGGSAIIAAPMISVSGDRAQRANAPAAPVAAVAPPAARPSALQGGWQSAGVPRPQSPEQTAAQGTPGAWAAAPTPAATSPQTAPRPLPPRPETPRPAAAGGGLQHTALASDYLRAARNAALGGGAPGVPRPATPASSLPGVAARSAQQTFAPQPAPQRSPQPHAPAQPPMDIPVNLAESFVARAAAPAPPTLGPPATAELSAPGPAPFQPPAAPASPWFAGEPELHGPRSIGTQASVAPPLSDAGASLLSPGNPARAPAPAAMATAASLVRNVQPAVSPLMGTMLDRTPSVPTAPQPALPSTPGAGHAGHSTRFEQVPSARGSLQATGFGLQIPIDHSASDWSRSGLDAAGPAKPKAKAPSQLRMILLAALALAAVGYAVFGRELLDPRQWSPTDGIEHTMASDDTRAPDQATLTNLPSTPAASATPPAPAGGTLPSNPGAAPAAGSSPTASSPTVSPPIVAAAPAVLPGGPPTTERAEDLDPAEAKATAEAGKAAEVAATPESRLAAQAGRHVLAARYAEALPLYRELQRSYPQNTAYAAMAHVLEQKTAAGGKPAAHP